MHPADDDGALQLARVRRELRPSPPSVSAGDQVVESLLPREGQDPGRASPVPSSQSASLGRAPTLSRYRSDPVPGIEIPWRCATFRRTQSSVTDEVQKGS